MVCSVFPTGDNFCNFCVNRYVDLLLGEFKQYKTRFAHGGIREEVQDLLLEYGLENVAETLIEGLSRVRRCTDEGRALMSLNLQEYSKNQIVGLINLVATMKAKWANAFDELAKYCLEALRFVDQRLPTDDQIYLLFETQ
ncbi:unnamed protein product [Fraxinus pennsylvanica]|uniref:Syndetin C-terminal domain-containing protein n=1 Tax=Fraxinus pennsylvanica TaxID=56036 RepID=A0AAD1ZRS1_9LAMI|nr:unnamed protein product [Fraxinus pennsylvanica]